jgi:hypothetical protein
LLKVSPFASLLMTVFAAALKRMTATGLACRLLRKTHPSLHSSPAQLPC